MRVSKRLLSPSILRTHNLSIFFNTVYCCDTVITGAKCSFSCHCHRRRRQSTIFIYLFDFFLLHEYRHRTIRTDTGHSRFNNLNYFTIRFFFCLFSFTNCSINSHISHFHVELNFEWNSNDLLVSSVAAGTDAAVDGVVHQ